MLLTPETNFNVDVYSYSARGCVLAVIVDEHEGADIGVDGEEEGDGVGGDAVAKLLTLCATNGTTFR